MKAKYLTVFNRDSIQDTVTSNKHDRTQEELHGQKIKKKLLT